MAEWITVAALARRIGVSRQGTLQRIERFEAAELVTTRKEGRKRLVDLHAYLDAVDRHGDLIAELNARGSSRDVEEDPETVHRRREAQAGLAEHRAARLGMQLAKARGLATDTVTVEELMSKAAVEIVRALDLQSHAAELYALGKKPDETAIAARLAELNEAAHARILAAVRLPEHEDAS